MSLDASVTLDDNIIDATPADCAVTSGGSGGGTLTPPPSPANETPEFGTFALLACGLLVMVFVTFLEHDPA